MTYLTYMVSVEITSKNRIENSLQTMPKFCFETLDHRKYSNIDLKENTPTVFIYFNTECEYCQHEANNISKNIINFKETQLIFISTENARKIKQFGLKYNLLNQKNISLLVDRSGSFVSQFDAKFIPFIVIYNKENELLKRHAGQLKAETIIKLLDI